MRILVVDDQEDARDLTEGGLMSAGFTDLVTASSAWEALKLSTSGAPPRRRLLSTSSCSIS